MCSNYQGRFKCVQITLTFINKICKSNKHPNSGLFTSIILIVNFIFLTIPFVFVVVH